DCARFGVAFLTGKDAINCARFTVLNPRLTSSPSAVATATRRLKSASSTVRRSSPCFTYGNTRTRGPTTLDATTELGPVFPATKPRDEKPTHARVEPRNRGLDGVRRRVCVLRPQGRQRPSVVFRDDLGHRLAPSLAGDHQHPARALRWHRNETIR